MISSLIDEKQSQRLQELGITHEDLESALKEGEFFRRNVTRHYPATAVGIGGWADTVAALRDNMAQKNWFAEDIKGVALTTRHDGAVSIAVASGDHGTSDISAEVASKYPKGFATAQVVEGNAQLSFFQSLESTSKLVGRQTWYLLYNRVGKQIFFELSLPLSMTDDSRLTEFSERIIFPPLDVDGLGFETLKAEALTPNYSKEIVVDVSPKSQNG